MRTDRMRSEVFFIEYVLVLLFAMFWVQFPHVRARIEGDTTPFYMLLAVAFCYVGLRAYLVLVRGFAGNWQYVWLAVDLAVITGAVYLTGGIRSEAALMYFWPIATSAIERKLARTIVVGLGSAVLYAAATWHPHIEPQELGWLGTRLFLFVIVTGLAACFAGTEAARIEDVARLREKVALADYRARLSQEMHDGIQHYLVNISLRLELARTLLEKDPARAARIAVDQRTAVRQAADELRYLVRRLRSPAIERQGFVDAVRDHLAMFSDRSSIAARLEIQGVAPHLPADVEQAAFRIVQEALTNAEKHADATDVRVTLEFGADLFRCVVADNGIGFEAAEAPEAGDIYGGFGLGSMQHRAESVDGMLQVDSSSGQGTQIVFTAPVREQLGKAREARDGQDQAADR